MSDKLNKIKYDKLLLEIQYLEAELEYTNSIIVENTHPFERLCEGMATKRGVWKEIQERRQKASKKGPPPQPNKKKKRIRKKDRDLFKKIAKEAHPDKLIHLSEEEKDLKEKIFLKASTALDGESPGDIRQAAIELGIDPGDIGGDDIESLEDRVEEITKRLENLKQGIIWVWSQKEKKEEKAEIVKMYINFLLTTLPE